MIHTYDLYFVWLCVNFARFDGTSLCSVGTAISSSASSLLSPCADIDGGVSDATSEEARALNLYFPI